MDELSFSLCEYFNIEEYVQLVLQPAYRRTSKCTFRKITISNYLSMKDNLMETLSVLNIKILLISNI